MKDDMILIHDVSHTFFSVSRHYGGATIKGRQYRYFHERDILVRNDWVKYYQRLAWEDFIEAVRTGVKPQLPTKTESLQPQKNNTPAQSSLFD